MYAFGANLGDKNNLSPPASEDAPRGLRSRVEVQSAHDQVIPEAEVRRTLNRQTEALSMNPVASKQPMLHRFPEPAVGGPIAGYGQSDIIPDGGAGMGIPFGGSLVGQQNFNEFVQPLRSAGVGSSSGPTLPGVRYNPMFPGDTGQGGPLNGRAPGPRFGQPPNTFPGEPDNDMFAPPGGPPGFGAWHFGGGPSFHGTGGSGLI